MQNPSSPPPAPDVRKMMDADGPSEVRPGRPDEELMLAFGRGDVDAFELLVRRWEMPLLNFIYRSIGDLERARELRQETFLRVIGARRRYRPTARFSTWLYRIAVNLCRSEHRKRRRRRESHLEEGRGGGRGGDRLGDVADRRPGPAAQAAREEMASLVRDAIDRLPPEQREVVILRQYHGMAFDEIAAIVGCPVSTAKSRMYYAMEHLRRLLEPMR